MSFIEQAIRKGKFGRVILRSKDLKQRSVDHCFFDKNLWPHGDRSWNHRNKGVVGEIDNFIDLTKLPPGGFLWSKDRLVVIPEGEVLKFELANNITTEQASLPPSRQPWKWIKSKELRIAVHAHHALYFEGEIDLIRPHKPQILEWLKKRYPSLNPNQLKTITYMVNCKKEGGAPRQ